MRSALRKLSSGLCLALALGVCLELSAPAGARADEAPAADGPFELQTLHVPGRPLEAWPARFDATRPGRDLVVVAVEGSAPGERRRLCVFARDAAGRLPSEPSAQLLVPRETVAFDIGPPRTGGADAIVLLGPEALRIVIPGASDASRSIALDPPAPLPPRGHELARLTFLDDWAGDGRTRALVPDLDGARLVALEGADVQRVSFPVHAEYDVRGGGQRIRDELLVAELHWPVLERADDDGDGRLDLFALSRFRVAVHRLGEGGLSRRPTRVLALRPFTPEEELRPRATSLRLFAQDLDGDGLADLVVHRTAGSLLRSRSLTEVFLNPGGGVQDLTKPSLRFEEPDGLVTLEPRDLDGDGRMELVAARLAFGVVQLARILTTSRAVVDVRVTPIPPHGTVGPPPRPSFERSITLRLDFATGSVVGLLPTAEGDWNGDGRRDLAFGRGPDELVVQLGSKEETGPGFSGESVSQDVPSDGLGRVADLDGDGLDDLVVVDPWDQTGQVRVLHNRGRLPGTPPALRAGGR